MPRSEEEIEELFGRQFALEAMLTQLIWEWAKGQPHPPSALSRYLRPLEEGMAKLAAQEEPENRAMRSAVETVRGIAQELERTLHREALLRADGEGQVQ